MNGLKNANKLFEKLIYAFHFVFVKNYLLNKLIYFKKCFTKLVVK